LRKVKASAKSPLTLAKKYRKGKPRRAGSRGDGIDGVRRSGQVGSIHVARTCCMSVAIKSESKCMKERKGVTRGLEGTPGEGGPRDPAQAPRAGSKKKSQEGGITKIFKGRFENQTKKEKWSGGVSWDWAAEASDSQRS